MKTAEPIRDIKKIALIKNLLKGQWRIRDLLMFELGINSALRISDILRVKVTDVFTIFGVPRESFDIKERKTGKTGKISITPKVKETLLVFKEKFPEIIKGRDNYLFFAQKTFPLGSKPIGRIQAWKIISGICEEVWLEGVFSCHSLRKTWWFQARQKGVPLELIMHRLNHSSMVMTKFYIWVTDNELADVCNKLDL